jgi:hypothetical protein
VRARVAWLRAARGRRGRFAISGGDGGCGGVAAVLPGLEVRLCGTRPHAELRLVLERSEILLGRAVRPRGLRIADSTAVPGRDVVVPPH